MLMKKCPKCCATVENEAEVCSNCGNVFPENRPFSKAGIAGFICSVSALASVPTALFSYFVMMISDSARSVRFFLILSVVSSIAAVICCLLGFIFSLKGLKDFKKENLRGRGIASAGLIMSSVLGGIGATAVTIFVVQALIIVSILAALILSPSSSGSSSSGSSSYVYREPSDWTSETTDYDNQIMTEEETTTDKRTMIYGTGPETINLWSFTDEIPKMVGQYIRQNPEFADKYTVECTIIATDGGAYQTALDNALAAGGETAPDIYAAEAGFVLKYSQGDMSKFASPYKDLGIDVDAKIKEADIAQYSVDIGTCDGKVVALGYQATGCVMIYNAEVAKDVFGTDDPEEIEKITGAGSGNWDKFFEAAEKLKEKGYAAVSGPSDIWNAVEKSADKPWLVDGQLTIDPKREKYLDIAKTLKDNGWSNDSESWNEPWYTDMKGEGPQKVFAFFGPAWLINYVMIGNSGGNKIGEGTYGQWRVCAPPVGFFWGGTWIFANKDTNKKEGVAELLEWITLDCSDTGLQYLWANGLVDWDNDPNTTTAKDTVASAVVMAKSDGSLDFCGRQNVFPAFINGNKYASAKALTPYDDMIGGYFEDAAEQYATGEVSREEAIENFKTNVQDNLWY